MQLVRASQQSLEHPLNLAVRRLSGLALIGVLVGACGSAPETASQTQSQTPSSQAPAATSTVKSTLPLKVVLGAVDPNGAGFFWVAYLQGYFKDESLDLTWQNVGANVQTAIASGQADIGAIGAANALNLAKNGVDTVIVYNHTSGRGSGFLFAKPGISSPRDCRSTATFAGSTTYAWAVTLKRELNLSYDIIPLTDTAIVRAGILSGQFDCVVSSLSTLASLADEGKIHILLDPREPTYPTSVPQGVSGGAWFGTRDNLLAKREAVVRFIHALGRGWADYQKMTADQIGALLRKEPSFQQFSDSALVSGSTAAKPFALDGFISSPAWSATIRLYKDGQLGLDAVDPTVAMWSYERRVDMSYYDAAIGAPKSP